MNSLACNWSLQAASAFDDYLAFVHATSFSLLTQMNMRRVGRSEDMYNSQRTCTIVAVGGMTQQWTSHKQHLRCTLGNLARLQHLLLYNRIEHWAGLLFIIVGLFQNQSIQLDLQLSRHSCNCSSALEITCCNMKLWMQVEHIQHVNELMQKGLGEHGGRHSTACVVLCSSYIEHLAHCSR